VVNLIVRFGVGLLIFAGGLAVMRYVLPGWVVISVASGAALVIRWIYWKCRTYTLTSRRVIVRHGVIDRVAETYWVNKIGHVKVASHFSGRFGGVGDVVLYGEDGSTVTFRHIANVGAFGKGLSSIVQAQR
jgi:uncharacterized membrane protein YdbT with pleckstrin-like domain